MIFFDIISIIAVERQYASIRYREGRFKEIGFELVVYYEAIKEQIPYYKTNLLNVKKVTNFQLNTVFIRSNNFFNTLSKAFLM